jgi:hypothetical protein
MDGGQSGEDLIASLSPRRRSPAYAWASRTVRTYIGGEGRASGILLPTMARSPEPQLVAVPDHNNDADADNDNNSDSGSDGDEGEQEVYEVEAIHASRYDPVAKSMR